MARKRKDREHETGASLWLGDAYRLRNIIEKALEYNQKSLQIAQERDDRRMKHVHILE